MDKAVSKFHLDIGMEMPKVMGKLKKIQKNKTAKDGILKEPGGRLSAFRFPSTSLDKFSPSNLMPFTDRDSKMPDIKKVAKVRRRLWKGTRPSQRKSEYIVIHPSLVYYIALVTSISSIVFGYNMSIIEDGLSRVVHHVQYTDNVVIYFSRLIEMILPGMCLFGSMISHYFGRRLPILVSCVILVIASAVLVWSPSEEAILQGALISVTGSGLVLAVTITHVAECAPKEIRGYLITFLLMGRWAGRLLSSFAVLQINEIDIVWRFVVALPALASIIQFALFCKVPESPQYMVMLGEFAAADATLQVIRFSKQVDTEAELRGMIEANGVQEMALKTEKSWKAVFKMRYVLRALCIGCLLQVFQSFSGIGVVRYYTREMSKVIEITGEEEFWLNHAVVPCVVMLAMLVGLYTIDLCGRKIILIISFLFMVSACTLTAIGFVLGYRTSPAASHVHDPGSEGFCATLNRCRGCIGESDNRCGFCALREGKHRQKGACVEVSHQHSAVWEERHRDEIHLHAVAGRCSANSSVLDKVIFMPDHCPDEYVVLQFVGLFALVISYSLGAGIAPWVLNAEIYPIWAMPIANGITTATAFIAQAVFTRLFHDMLKSHWPEVVFTVILSVNMMATVFVFVFVRETKGTILGSTDAVMMDKSDKKEYEENRCQLYGDPILYCVLPVPRLQY